MTLCTRCKNCIYGGDELGGDFDTFLKILVENPDMLQQFMTELKKELNSKSSRTSNDSEDSGDDESDPVDIPTELNKFVKRLVKREDRTKQFMIKLKSGLKEKNATQLFGGGKTGDSISEMEHRLQEINAKMEAMERENKLIPRGFKSVGQMKIYAAQNKIYGALYEKQQDLKKKLYPTTTNGGSGKQYGAVAPLSPMLSEKDNRALRTALGEKPAPTQIMHKDRVSQFLNQFKYVILALNDPHGAIRNYNIPHVMRLINTNNKLHFESCTTKITSVPVPVIYSTCNGFNQFSNEFDHSEIWETPTSVEVGSEWKLSSKATFIPSNSPKKSNQKDSLEKQLYNNIDTKNILYRRLMLTANMIWVSNDNVTYRLMFNNSVTYEWKNRERQPIYNICEQQKILSDSLE